MILSRQLIAQNRDGKIHALISTESNATFTRLKISHSKSRLYDKIDQQTDALISMIGENQMNYRFFIGFKFILNDQGVFYEKKSYR